MEINVADMGQKLALLRGNKTLTEVANDLRISKSALAMYETGRRIPRDQIKIRIAEYYGKSVAYIFFNGEEHDSCSN